MSFHAPRGEPHEPSESSLKDPSTSELLEMVRFLWLDPSKERAGGALKGGLTAVSISSFACGTADMGYG